MSQSRPPLTLHVESIECGHCVTMIASAVRQVPGATETSVDRVQGTVSVAGDVDRNAVRPAIEVTGYTAAP